MSRSSQINGRRGISRYVAPPCRAHLNFVFFSFFLFFFLTPGARTRSALMSARAATEINLSRLAVLEIKRGHDVVEFGWNTVSRSIVIVFLNSAG